MSVTDSATIKNHAAFIIGVADDGSVCGLAADYASMHKAGKDDRDLFKLYVSDIVTASMGAATTANMASYIHTIDGADVCRVHVHSSGVPVEAKVTLRQEGPNNQENCLLRSYQQRHEETRRYREAQVHPQPVAERWYMRAGHARVGKAHSAGGVLLGIADADQAGDAGDGDACGVELRLTTTSVCSQPLRRQRH